MIIKNGLISNKFKLLYNPQGLEFTKKHFNCSLAIMIIHHNGFLLTPHQLAYCIINKKSSDHSMIRTFSIY